MSFTLLLAAAAASGVLTVGFELARSAWLAQRIDARDLPRRNAQLSVAGSLSEAAAFGAGGWLYQGLGAALALAVDAASYAASALCLRGVPEAQAPRSAPLAMSGAIPVAIPDVIPGAMSGATSAATSTANSPTAPWRALAAEVADGLRAIAARPPLRALAGIEALLSFGMALTGTSIMIFVSRDLGLPTGQLGMIFALGGVGAVLGASLAPRLGRRFGPGRTMAFGLAILTLGSAFAPLAEGAGWAAAGWLIAQQIVGDAGHTVHDVHDRTWRQTAVPAALLARVDAGIRSAGQFATLAGAAVGGLIGNAFGTRTVLWLAVAAMAAAALLAAWRLAEPRWPVVVRADPQ